MARQEATNLNKKEESDVAQLTGLWGDAECWSAEEDRRNSGRNLPLLIFPQRISHEDTSKTPGFELKFPVGDTSA